MQLHAFPTFLFWRIFSEAGGEQDRLDRDDHHDDHDDHDDHDVDDGGGLGVDDGNNGYDDGHSFSVLHD